MNVIVLPRGWMYALPSSWVSSPSSTATGITKSSPLRVAVYTRELVAPGGIASNDSARPSRVIDTLSNVVNPVGTVVRIGWMLVNGAFIESRVAIIGWWTYVHGATVSTLM